MNKEMQKALEADGEKLRALTDEDHGPVFLDDTVPEDYAAEVRVAFPGITETGIASFYRARHLPTD